MTLRQIPHRDTNHHKRLVGDIADPIRSGPRPSPITDQLRSSPPCGVCPSLATAIPSCLYRNATRFLFPQSVLLLHCHQYYYYHHLRTPTLSACWPVRWSSPTPCRHHANGWSAGWLASEPARSSYQTNGPRGGKDPTTPPPFHRSTYLTPIQNTRKSFPLLFLTPLW
jgi:hypothetical protein